ncbi:hypothetical protein RRG08_038566 [Elysia crispata]|uniref:Uncharacterized protein n=1 Tax=Elysia crispata TaxID=231223 RepID=A0AAE0YFN6_9GAST|nr:hypothetical protein RRG08_038566 [Elysia crispata]
MSESRKEKKCIPKGQSLNRQGLKEAKREVASLSLYHRDGENVSGLQQTRFNCLPLPAVDTAQFRVGRQENFTNLLSHEGDKEGNIFSDILKLGRFDI